ncbi:MAG: hypothetical protein LBJ02_00520 [Bifidobacteriaceae bacterium]|jgi:hypothetical protein|nr:hypothetical protein [Bifidobacteriaceae bacterium]
MSELEGLRATVNALQHLQRYIEAMSPAAAKMRDAVVETYPDAERLEKHWLEHASEEEKASTVPPTVQAVRVTQGLEAALEAFTVMQETAQRAQERQAEIERRELWMVVRDGEAVADDTYDGIYWMTDGEERKAVSEEGAVNRIRERMAAKELEAIKEGFEEAVRIMEAASSEEPKLDR